jgi:hypothetical protein
MLDRAIVDRLELEWATSVAHLSDDPRRGFDGVTYTFLTRHGCAEVWVPESGTRPAQLADLVERIIRGDDGAAIDRVLDELIPAPGQGTVASAPVAHQPARLPPAAPE